MSKPRWLSLAFFKEWALLTLSLASGGFTVLLGLGLYILGKEPPKSGVLTLLQICSIGAAWGAWLQERRTKLELIAKRKPQLKVPADGFRRLSVFYPQSFVNDDGSPFHTSYLDLWTLVLRIENDPKESVAESVATAVAARLIFYDSQGQELFNIEGRWSDSTQPPNLEKHRTAADLKTATIAIGTQRQLDLVLKYKHERRCCAVNNDSYSFDLLQNPSWRLDPGDYQIKVRFRGVDVDQTFLLKFRNSEGNEPLEPLSCEEIAP